MNAALLSRHKPVWTLCSVCIVLTGGPAQYHCWDCRSAGWTRTNGLQNTPHKLWVDSGCRDSPVACLYRLLREQRHRFKTRRWLTPNGLNPTTEHAVTAPRGQPPLVTSTSASGPSRPRSRVGHGPGHGSVTAPDTGRSRPRSRVEDTNGPPARRCSCKLRPDSESRCRVADGVVWISPAVRSGPWMLRPARRPIRVAAAPGCDTVQQGRRGSGAASLQLPSRMQGSDPA